MDFGIRGRRALVCGASRGLGLACAQALADEGVQLTLCARRPEPLALAAQHLRSRSGIDVVTVPVDVTTPEGRETLFTKCPEVDLLVTNAGGPPTGDSLQWSHAQWVSAIEANMLSPIALIQAYIGGMQSRGFGRVVNITSAQLKSPQDPFALSNAARVGLLAQVSGLARKVAVHGITINNLLPGPFETDRLQAILNKAASDQGLSVEEARAQRQRQNPMQRFGDPSEFGAACAFLCSRQAGYITAQNWVIDGGAYPGLF